MPTNWPPASAPSWPPAELAGGFSFAGLRDIAAKLRELGFTQAAPTPAEQTAYFASARCDHNHQVIGRMLVAPSGVRYPVAVCNNAAHRDVLVQFPPYYCGAGSGEE